MRALVALVLAAALTAPISTAAGAAHACAPGPPRSSEYTTGRHATPVGSAEVRGGPDHVGASVGKSYLFADGDPNGGLVYGQVAVTGPVIGGYPVFNGPEFRVGGGADESDACAEPYR